MTRIESVTRLAALVRRRMDRADTSSAPRRPPTAASQAGTGPHAGATGHASEAAALVARRVRALDPADRDRPRRAFRAFLTSVLLAELGAQLADDPGFGDLVERVQRDMESDAGLAASIDTATRALLDGSS